MGLVACAARVGDPKFVTGFSREHDYFMVPHFSHPSRGSENVAKCDLL
jgi:hypothetical protein